MNFNVKLNSYPENEKIKIEKIGIMFYSVPCEYQENVFYLFPEKGRFLTTFFIKNKTIIFDTKIDLGKMKEVGGFRLDSEILSKISATTKFYKDRFAREAEEREAKRDKLEEIETLLVRIDRCYLNPILTIKNDVQNRLEIIEILDKNKNLFHSDSDFYYKIENNQGIVLYYVKAEKAVKFINNYKMEKIKKLEKIKEKEDKYLNEKINEAKKLGKLIIFCTNSVECNDPREECSLDIITTFIDGKGVKTQTRQHTW